jgi:hypothetical protein
MGRVVRVDHAREAMMEMCVSHERVGVKKTPKYQTVVWAGRESSPKYASQTPRHAIGVLKQVVARWPRKCMNSVFEGSRWRPTDRSQLEACS